MKRKFQKGVVDPISLIAVLFLVVTLTVGTAVTTNKDFSLNMFEKASGGCEDKGSPKARQACRKAEEYDPNDAVNVAYRKAHPETYSTTTVNKLQPDGSTQVVEVTTKKR